MIVLTWGEEDRMLEVYQSTIRNQYEAAFRTLAICSECCPDVAWNAKVCNYVISQTFFHTLFYADMYLGPSPEAISDQAFHAEHSAVFAGYEEVENKMPTRQYDREFIAAYFDHCRSKADHAIQRFNEFELSEPSGFSWIQGTAAEVHVYNIRHIQHHAAQLSLRLRIDHQIDVPWVKSGWET